MIKVANFLLFTVLLASSTQPQEVSEAKVAKAPVDDLEAQRSVEWDGEDWKFGEQ